MNTQTDKHIEKLVERFFDGSTSNEEEQELYRFFSGENIPEQLLPYRPVFAYFETGIKNENWNESKIKTVKSTRKRTLFWVGIAASLLILIVLRMFYVEQTKAFNPYEGSYIIRKGVKITDPKIVRPEIEKTLHLAMLMERIEQESPYAQAVKRIKEEQKGWLNQMKDETFREEAIKIINSEL
ncbi:hypothetical protein AGMMS50262_10110 [Bacteroidia bacterium]|nr:hypothetical protein AGMMS50262_10110 [Bacteroidia bacterium]